MDISPSFSEAKPLLEFINDEALEGNPQGAYLILVKELGSSRLQPYYAGKGDIRQRLRGHVINWLGGAYSIWDVEKMSQWGSGLTTITTVRAAGENVRYAYFPNGSGLGCHHDLPGFLEHCAESSRTFVRDHLYVRVFCIEHDNEEERKKILAYAETRLIKELSSRFRLANGRQEAGSEWSPKDDIARAIDDLVAGYSSSSQPTR